MSQTRVRLSNRLCKREVNSILDFLEVNPDLVSGPSEKNAKSSAYQRQLWQDCADILNAKDLGRHYTYKIVRDKWKQLKYRVKKQASMIKNARDKSGGGSPGNNVLSEVQDRIIRLIGIGSTCTGLTDSPAVQSLQKDNVTQVRKKEQESDDDETPGPSKEANYSGTEESDDDNGSSYFGTRRTGQEIKRKWADLKSRVKAKAASLAIDSDLKSEEGVSVKLTPVEERVLAIISQNLGDSDGAQGSKGSGVKVFSYHSENSDDQLALQYNEDEGSNTDAATNEAVIVEEIKLSGNQDKKRRISEAFSTPNAERKLGFKRIKVISEEEQLQNLCASQMEITSEIRSIREILKKCQVSIEKVALLKRAELRLKCAKYGVEFEDLFD